MARIVLIMPPMPQPMGAPYLGQLYVAASAMADGHDVRCIDLAAPLAPRGSEGFAFAVDEVRRFKPDIVGMTLFTAGAARGYRLAKLLRPHTPMLVAGGPHPTVVPGEPQRFGFDRSVVGEGEHAIIELARACDAKLSKSVMAPRAPDDDGRWLEGSELDRLPFPHTAYDAFDRTMYGHAGVSSSGIMSSRGCPARCTFCANYVTGRSYRWRSTENVVAEIIESRQRYGIRHVAFWDDAFTARRPRLNAICDAFLNTPKLRGLTWSVITPGNMVKPFDLQRMRRAGCVSVNFGIESGDHGILKVIQKGQKPKQVVEAVRAAKEAGMQTIVNFMFGFPEEGLAELGNTLDLMQELAPMTDYFNSRGVLVPFPGTAVYDRWRDTYDLEGWWLDESRVPLEDSADPSDPLAAMRRECEDPALDQNFFDYPPDVSAMIARCVRFKGEHNLNAVKQAMGGAAA